jgi:sugar phosphate permease
MANPAVPNIYPDLASDLGEDEKKLGGTDSSVTPSVIDAPAELLPEHAAEYMEFLTLQQHFQADPEVYAKLVRRLDCRIIPMLFLYYLFNGLDKSNAGNVKIYTFLKDTHMTGTQFNLAQTWFFITYGLFEAPSNMCMRKFGPRLWLSGMVFCWGAVTLGSAWVKSYGDYAAARIVLGIFEAGLFQGCFFTLSCWYPRGELQRRCAYWYSATMLSGAFVSRLQ